MSPTPSLHCVAFEGTRRIAAGTLAEVAAEAKRAVDRAVDGPVLVFDAVSSEGIELDLRGTLDEVLARLPAACPAPACEDETPPAEVPRGRGRPKLGVVAREVTLLPRHWAWLGEQPGGASVALRKLVEEARRTHAGRDQVRLARESAYRFMSVMASGQVSFEEAARALFAGQRAAFEAQLRDWPSDLREHTLALADPSFTSS